MLSVYPMNISHRPARFESLKSSSTPFAAVDLSRGFSPTNSASPVVAGARSRSDSSKSVRPIEAETFRYVYLTTCKNKRDWLKPLRRLYEDPSRRWRAK
jgi:hypothetical protein